MTIGLFFILLAIFLVISLPVGAVFGLMAILPGMMGTLNYGAIDVARAMFSGMNSFTLLAVPLFMVSGMIMAEGGISKQLFEFFGYFIGNKTAGFPCAVVVTCMFYAAISGSAPATVSAVGSMTIPFLVNMGYDVVFSTAIVTVAGALGVIIPPSISYIVYSAAANASPSALFIAGIIPGCLIGFFLMGYCWYYCKKNGEDKEKLQERYAKLSGGVAVIRVGAATETEMKEAKLRMEDALAATRAAVEEGIICGGGSAYIHASKEVAKLVDTLEGDEKTGGKVILKALEAPLFHIAVNAGLEGAVIINKVRESEVGVGFDAYNEQYVNMVDAGILDPAKVTRTALQNATSVASTFLTTEACVANIKEETPAAPAGGGMGMM